MSVLRSALLYASLVFGANAAFADASVDLSDVAALRDGDMEKLVLHDTGNPAAEATFLDAEGGQHDLSEYRGKYVLLNFWATWCAPCRKEMGALDVLSRELGGDKFVVVPVATGRNPVPAVKKLFADVGVQSLPILLDKPQKLAREMAVFGLPTTVILDPEGHEIGRMRGDADWASDSAKAIVSALIGG